MPRYFFHLHQLHRHVIDPEGADFGSADQARAEALLTINEIVGERMRNGQELELLSIRICDETGEVIDEVFVDEALRKVVPAEALARLLKINNG